MIKNGYTQEWVVFFSLRLKNTLLKYNFDISSMTLLTLHYRTFELQITKFNQIQATTQSNIYVEAYCENC